MSLSERYTRASCTKGMKLSRFLSKTLGGLIWNSLSDIVSSWVGGLTGGLTGGWTGGLGGWTGDSGGWTGGLLLPTFSVRGSVLIDCGGASSSDT